MNQICELYITENRKYTANKAVVLQASLGVSNIA